MNKRRGSRKFCRRWMRAAIIVHYLPDAQYLPEAPDGMVRFLDPAALQQSQLRMNSNKNSARGAEQSLIAATFEEQHPVSFCYAGAMTESLWDISIDTVPEYRRRGHAALCVAHMIRYMYMQGKRPVWQALEDNPGSWRLAQKLGFVPVDELVLFRR